MNNSPISPFLSAGLTFTGTPSAWPLISAEVISSQPLTLAQQHYLNQLLTQTQQNTQSSLMKALAQTPQNHQNSQNNLSNTTAPSAVSATGNSSSPTRTANPALQLVRLLIAGNPRWLLAEKPQVAGTQVQLQVTPKGLILQPSVQAKPQIHDNQPRPEPAKHIPQASTNTSQAPSPKVLNSLVERWLAGIGQPAQRPTTEAAISRILRQAINLTKPVNDSHQALLRLPAVSRHPVIAEALSRAVLTLPTNALQVKTAIQQSGLFAEAGLEKMQVQTAHTTLPAEPATKADTKLLLWGLLALSGKASGSGLLQQLLNLLQLPSEWTPEPKQLPQLKAEIRSWLATITRHQLQLLSQQQSESTDPPRLQLELPIKSDPHTLPLQLCIEKHWQRPEEQEAGAAKRQNQARIAEWSFSLSIDIPQQGPLDVRLRSDGQRLSCTLWTDSPLLEASINQRINQLAQSMKDDGIELSQIRCLPGRMPTSAAPLKKPLLDTHA